MKARARFGPRAPQCAERLLVFAVQRGDEDPAKGPYWHDDPEHLAALYAYCQGDVECERDLWRWLSC